MRLIWTAWNAKENMGEGAASTKTITGICYTRIGELPAGA